MFATNYFLVSFLFIHHISVVPVLSSCPESFTATNVSALGLTVYTAGSSDCDCKCVVGVNSNASLSTGSSTCSESTAENTTLGFLIAITVINAILLVALIVIVVLYGVIAFRKKYGWVKSSVKHPNTNVNDAYGMFDLNDEDTYSNHGYSQVEAAGQHLNVTKTDKDTHGYSVVEATGTEVQLQNAGKKDEDAYSNLAYSLVESAGTEAKRLSTALLLPRSAAEDTEENEYSYTDMRLFPDAKPGKKGKGKKSDRAKEKGEKSVPGKEISEQGKEEGEKSEPVKEKAAEPGEKDKPDTKDTAAKNPIVKAISGETAGEKLEYTPVIEITKDGAKNTHNEDTKTAASPFGVILKSTESSSSSAAVSKFKKDPAKSAQPKKYAAASKQKKDPQSTACALLASAAASKAKKESKMSQSKITFVSKFKKDSKPTASAQAAAEEEEKKETKAKSGGASGK